MLIWAEAVQFNERCSRCVERDNKARPHVGAGLCPRSQLTCNIGKPFRRYLLLEFDFDECTVLSALKNCCIALIPKFTKCGAPRATHLPGGYWRKASASLVKRQTSRFDDGCVQRPSLRMSL